MGEGGAMVVNEAAGRIAPEVLGAVVDLCRVAAGTKDGRRLVERLARLLVEVPGCADAVATMGLLAKVSSQDQAALTSWVARMVAARKLSEADLRSVVDIQRAIAQPMGAPAGLKAVDPARLHVDGGKLPEARLGGLAGMTDEWQRYEAWCAYYRALPGGRWRVKGSRETVALWVLVARVVVDGVSPYSLDEHLGVMRGSVQKRVLAAVHRYTAMHFSA